MNEFIHGVVRFQKDVFPGRRALFAELANGQSPEVLLITCADSRIDPNMVTQTEPGELFICRNAGNIVPPHQNEAGGVTASIEYAVAVLGVSHIVVCGHTDCGAMKAAINPGSLEGLPHVSSWLGHTRAAAEVVKAQHGCLGTEHLDEMTRANVTLQLQHLRTHPAVAARIATGDVQLHGWVYNIETGEVNCYDPVTEQYSPLQERYAKLLARGEDVRAAS